MWYRFYFSTNPLGAEKDGYATQNGTMNWDWNAVWEVKTTRDEKGWYSEFAIPLSQIRFRASQGAYYPKQVCRSRPATSESCRNIVKAESAWSLFCKSNDVCT